MNRLTFDRNGFYLDGRPFRIISGDIHYFRIHEKDWEKRLDLALDFGLNTIQTYVPWNAHEPKPGEYRFEGMLDLGAFLKLCGEKGLKVLLRPAPYICSEWDFGGLPAWLLKDPEVAIRSSEPHYLAAVKRYYDRLIPEFQPYLATNSGPVIAVALENEYGSYGNDHPYLRALADMFREGGVDVPLYTTDGNTFSMFVFGREDKENFFGVNFRAKPGFPTSAEANLHRLDPDKPFFVGEFWAGRSMHWGEPFFRRDPKETSESLREALELNGNVSFYMFSGGTSFGFMGGANVGASYSPRPGTPLRYIPHTTSYSEDTMLGEAGEVTDKYFLCRDVLDDYLGREKRPHVREEHKAQALQIRLTEAAPLFENLDALTETKACSAVPRPMEAYGQNYGLILYSTKLDAFTSDPAALQPYKYKDRANIYVDGKWHSTYLRDRGATRIAAGTPLADSLPALLPDGTEKKIDVLVENLGRINFSAAMTDERKGLEDCILFGKAKLHGYETRTLPLEDLSFLDWQEAQEAPIKDHLPCFFRGRFDAEAGIDTYVSSAGFDHGYIWVNGFNLGRYDSAGPQMTLYLPGHFLKEKDNELIVLDLDPMGEKTTVDCLDHEILEGEAEELR